MKEKETGVAFGLVKKKKEAHYRHWLFGPHEKQMIEQDEAIFLGHAEGIFDESRLDSK